MYLLSRRNIQTFSSNEVQIRWNYPRMNPVDSLSDVAAKTNRGFHHQLLYKLSGLIKTVEYDSMWAISGKETNKSKLTKGAAIEEHHHKIIKYK